jgi:RNA polymerase sigma-70 factor (ECF subfamily)
MVAPSDAELAAQALAGSQDACQALVARYASAVVNLAARMVHDSALAEDLAQEAFVRAFTRLETFDPGRKFSSWLFQVAHNVTVDYLRRKRLNTVPIEEASTAGHAALMSSAAASSPAAYAEQEQLARAIAQGLARIRPEYREALTLHYQQGLTHAEVGEIMDAPVGTVKTYLHRGRAELASILAKQGWGPAAGEPSKPDDGRIRKVSRD